MINAILTVSVSLLACVVLLPRLAHIASDLGLVDHPNRRKVHSNPKPLVGGIGMSLAVAFSSLLFIPLTTLRGVFAGSVLLVVAGFLDDYKELGHKAKFIAQVIAACLMIFFSSTWLYTFGDLLALGSIDFPFLTIPITIFSTVGVINAVNMIDGIDGLAGGVMLTAFLTFGLLAYMSDQRELMLYSLALSGALVGFLRYNWHPSALFMGDAGSLFLGFNAAFISIRLTQHADSIIPPVVPLLVVAVPIVDTITVMAKRVIKGHSPFHADRWHFHHILLRMGFSKRATAGILIMLSVLASTIAVSGAVLKIPEYTLFYFFISYGMCYFAVSFRLKKLLRLKRHLGNRRELRREGFRTEGADSPEAKACEK